MNLSFDVSFVLLVIATSTGFLRVRGQRPNIIVMQPDDLQFYDEWSPPPNNPTQPDRENPVPPIPNIERLRTDGVWMKQAYTAAPKCGTSRYSTLTGKYPSRSAISRKKAEGGDGIADVTIPKTKLKDKGGLDDCSVENLGAQFKASGEYRTGMIGKWHLSTIKDSDYSYESAVATVQGCGFDFVGGLYVENLAASEDNFGNYYDGTFSHNMEWITYEAINFINDAADAGEPFFLYFNPTVPHGNNDVRTAMEDFPCRNTSNGVLDFDPVIPGMTDDGNCAAYRETVFDRAGNDDELGAIWIDDGVGAILQALDDKGILDDTIFLFQQDHGMETKEALYENGVRIAQFVHYPAEIPAGTEFEAPVSTVDIGPTLLDYAGLVSSYNMDGTSWKDAILSETTQADWSSNRCVYFENEKDRAVRCGCYKYLNIVDITTSSTYTRGVKNGYATDLTNLFDLCGGTDNYVTDKGTNMEATNIITEDPVKGQSLAGAIKCHLARTDVDSDPDFSTCDPSGDSVTCPDFLKRAGESCKKGKECCSGVCDKKGVGCVGGLPEDAVWPSCDAWCKKLKKDGSCKKTLPGNPSGTPFLECNSSKEDCCPKKHPDIEDKSLVSVCIKAGKKKFCSWIGHGN